MNQDSIVKNADMILIVVSIGAIVIMLQCTLFSIDSHLHELNESVRHYMLEKGK